VPKNMATYKYLGRRGPLVGALDYTGLNSGNWTIAFTPAILNFTVPQATVYKLQVSGALGSNFNIYVDSDQWDVNIFGTQNSWHDDAGDELMLRVGQTLFLMYSDPVTDGTPPEATLFLRYDDSLSALLATLWVRGLTLMSSRLPRWYPLGASQEQLTRLPWLVRLALICR
jgi:hypothetical protein